MTTAPVLSGSLCARQVSVAVLEVFTIRRSFPLPYFSVTPRGRAAIWRISSFRILAATRNALICEHINADMYTMIDTTANKTADQP